jgi:Glyoxalase-like domain
MDENRSTRREWLRLCAGAGAYGFLVSPARAGESLAPAVSAVDHLLLGAADLDRGIAWVEKVTGVRPAAGGSHPGVGTRNALLSLGGQRYLELIAPDPAQKDFRFHIDVRKLSEPRLITWAAATDDAEGLAKKARAAGYSIFGPREGSRARPDGRTLRWKTVGVTTELGGDGVEPIPFFIEWAGASVHPSQDSPKGCELTTFEIEHPRPDAVKDMLAKLGIEAKVGAGTSVRLSAALRTPKGTLKLR